MSSLGTSSGASVSTTDSSTSITVPHAVLWPRSEVFEYGVLPLPSKSKLDLHNLLALVRKYRHIHEINSKYFTVINSLHLDSRSREFSQTFACVFSLPSCMFEHLPSFPTGIHFVPAWGPPFVPRYSRLLFCCCCRFPEWETVALEDLHLYDAYVRRYEGSVLSRLCHLCFCDSVTDFLDFDCRLLFFFLAGLIRFSSLAVHLTASVPCERFELATERDVCSFGKKLLLFFAHTPLDVVVAVENQTVNFYEFMIFLYIQLIGRTSYASTAAKGAHWPAHAMRSPSASSPAVHTTPSSAAVQPPSTPQPPLSPLSTPKRRSPYQRIATDLTPLKPQALFSPQRTPGRVPPLQLQSVRTSSAKKDGVDRLDLGLDEQKQFIIDHIDFLLLLLSADNHSGSIAAHELDALGFILCVGPDIFSRLESPLSDSVPDYIAPVSKQDPRSPTLMTVFYPRNDIAVRFSRFLCHRLG